MKGQIRIHARAERSASLFTITATTVCYIERHHDPVPFLQEGDARARFENNTHVFMAWLLLSASWLIFAE
jgi:hypothetical protein